MTSFLSLPQESCLAYSNDVDELCRGIDWRDDEIISKNGTSDRKWLRIYAERYMTFDGSTIISSGVSTLYKSPSSTHLLKEEGLYMCVGNWIRHPWSYLFIVYIIKNKERKTRKKLERKKKDTQPKLIREHHPSPFSAVHCNRSYIYSSSLSSIQRYGL